MEDGKESAVPIQWYETETHIVCHLACTSQCSLLTKLHDVEAVGIHLLSGPDTGNPMQGRLTTGHVHTCSRGWYRIAYSCQILFLSLGVMRVEYAQLPPINPDQWSEGLLSCPKCVWQLRTEYLLSWQDFSYSNSFHFFSLQRPSMSNSVYHPREIAVSSTLVNFARQDCSFTSISIIPKQSDDLSLHNLSQYREASAHVLLSHNCHVASPLQDKTWGVMSYRKHSVQILIHGKQIFSIITCTRFLQTIYLLFIRHPFVGRMWSTCWQPFSYSGTTAWFFSFPPSTWRDHSHQVSFWPWLCLRLRKNGYGLCTSY